MVTKTIKPKKQNKNSNSTAEEKPQKTIKKDKDDVSKLKKKLKDPKTAAALVEVSAKSPKKSELPAKKKNDKKPKKEEVVEESSSDIADESVIEESEEEQIADDSDEEDSGPEEQPAKKSKTHEEQDDDDKEDSDVGLGYTIFVANYPPKYTRKDLANLFAPAPARLRSILFYSSSDEVFFTSPPGGFTNRAYIVLDSPEAVNKALELNGKLINDRRLVVTNPEKQSRFNPNKSIFVTNLKISASEDQIREIFSSCGRFEDIKISKCTRSNTTSVYIGLSDENKVLSALELNGTLVDGQAIQVKKLDIENTVFVGNLNKFTKEDGLHNVFSSCGEVLYVLLKGSRVAYVIFKDAESAAKALKLHNTQLDRQNIKVSKYTSAPIKTKRPFTKTMRRPPFGKKYLGKKFDPNFNKNKAAGIKKVHPTKKEVAKKEVAKKEVA